MFLHRVFTITILGACYLLAVGASFGQSTDLDRRSALQKTWTEQQTKHPSLYQSAPATQVVPVFNTISYALLLDKQEAVIVPENSSLFIDETLTLTGYRMAPHLSISLKNIGLGFAADIGQRNAIYSRSARYTTGSGITRQQSHLDYRGVGGYVYWILPQPFGRKLRPSLTLGHSSLAAKHRVSHFRFNSVEPVIEDGDFRYYTYGVNRTECGLNLGFLLLKKFTLIPWVNYENIDSSEGAKKAEEDSDRGDILAKDVELFWHSQARVKYGLDFSMRLFDTVELHLGGLLGAVSAFGANNDQIVDKTISASIAFDQKGN